MALSVIFSVIFSEEWQIYRISDFKGCVVIFEVQKVSVSCLTMTRLLTQCLTKYESFHVSMELNYDNKYKYIGKCYKSYQKYASFKRKFCCFVLDNFFLFSSGKGEVEVEETS